MSRAISVPSSTKWEANLQLLRPAELRTRTGQALKAVSSRSIDQANKFLSALPSFSIHTLPQTAKKVVSSFASAPVSLRKVSACIMTYLCPSLKDSVMTISPFSFTGRTILGDAAYELFSRIITTLVDNLKYDAYDPQAITAFLNSVEDQEHLRRQVTASGELPLAAIISISESHDITLSGLVAFVPNGAILPRGSGASDAPMGSPSVIQFTSPPKLERTFVLPHRGAISGMGIPKGITMIAGGGFHVCTSHTSLE